VTSSAMIAEVVIGSFTLLTVSSLALVNAIEKRAHKRYEPEPEEPEKPSVDLYPFVYWVGSDCVMCGRKSEMISGCRWGPKNPEACKDKNCAAEQYRHLHMHCNTCESNWLMKTKS
jgi:hypothetical protein